MLAVLLHRAIVMRAAWLVCLALGGCDARIADDLGGLDDGKGDGNGRSARCKQVDVVFSIDNSGSMQLEQKELRERSFPAFAPELLKIAGGLDDYRVGVLDACDRPASFHTRGVRGECNFAGGNPWMDSSSPSLVAEYDCVADIYSGDAQCSGNDDDEQPAMAAAAALEPAWAGPGRPNEGFLRDDALLVVVAITDEDEHPVSGADARQIYDRLVATKGDVRKIVFVGIGGSDHCEGDYGRADDAEKLEDITELFRDMRRGVFWDLCDGGLDRALVEALDTIEDACEDYPLR